MVLIARVACAIASALALSVSFQPTGWWWAGWISAALIITALSPWRRWPTPSWWATTLIGVTWGAATGVASLGWIAEFVGNLPWLGLCVALGLFHVLTATGIRVIMGAARLPWATRAIGAAAWIIAVEALLARWPFGGFPWLRYAWGQVGGPVEDIASIGGTPLTGFVVTLIGAGAVIAICGRRILTGLTVAAVAFAAGWLTPANAADPQPGERTAVVAAIQGNVPRMGLGFNAQRRAVLENHAEATRQLADAVREGRAPKPDVVIWPENSADVSPLVDSRAARIVDDAVAAIGVPVVIGSFSYDDHPARGNGTMNTMIVWDPGQGPVDKHVKKYLQPFGEWMPFRDLLRNVTDLVDLAGDMTPGTGDGVAVAGGIPIGFATCFEVIFDAAYRDAVNNGAVLLATPTNNATFGFTGMTYQQLAMSRLRAIENDRAVVVAATSGVSAMIRPDGTVTDQSGIFGRAILTDTLPLRENRTIAARHGVAIESAIAALAIVALVAAVVRRPRATPAGDDAVGDDDHEGAEGA